MPENVDRQKTNSITHLVKIVAKEVLKDSQSNQSETVRKGNYSKGLCE